jgi:hypothetical protein
MALSEEARERLADVVDRQPTKNAELQAAWGMDSGSEVHRYLEDELGDYYYRDDDSLIRATPEGEALITGESPDGPRTVVTTDLGAAILDCLPGPDERSQSVVATLHDLREAGHDPPVDDVRSTLHTLAERGAVERIRTTVPTFRLALPRADLAVEESG